MRNSKNVLKYLFCLVILTQSACAPKGEGQSVAGPAPTAPDEKPAPGEGELAHGIINGKRWEYRQGRAKKIVVRGRKYFEVQLWNQFYSNPCDAALKGSDLQVRIQSESLRGEWVLGQDPFVLFPKIVMSDFSNKMEPSNNMIASKGAFRLSRDLINNEVYGSFFSEFPGDINGETWATGEFSVTFCDP